MRYDDKEIKKNEASMFLKNLSIKRKIVYLFLPIAILPMLLFAIISMNIYENAFINRSLESMMDNNQLIVNRMDGILSEAEGSATYLTLSINRIVNSNEFGGSLSNEIKFFNLISNELSYAKLIYKQVDSIAFIDTSNKLYYSDYELQNNKTGLIVSPMIQSLEATTGYGQWFEMNTRDFLIKEPNKKVLTLGKKIWNINSGETLGYLLVNISEDAFRSIFSEQLAYYSIYNSQDDLVIDSEAASSSSEKIAFLGSDKNSNILNQNEEKILVTKLDFSPLNWRIVSEANLDLFIQDLSNIILLLIFLLITIIILEITMTLVINQLITSPILKLKKGAEEISKGNFNFKFNMRTNDEIGMLAKSFNTMGNRVDLLVKEVAGVEEKKRQYELALLQQQIKPHFLYNTLDIILKLSQMGQARKAQMVTRRLGEYYRNSLSGGADIVEIQTEVKLTEDYLSLQQLRYPDLFEFKINLTEKIALIDIPKLTLQPIVENAIEHGFINEIDNGIIQIYSRCVAEDLIEIIIEDNGVGISEERVTKLNEMFASTEAVNEVYSIKSFGLKNINHRLKLHCGNTSGITIESEQNEYTRVIIRLHAKGVHCD